MVIEMRTTVIVCIYVCSAARFDTKLSLLRIKKGQRMQQEIQSQHPVKAVCADTVYMYPFGRYMLFSCTNAILFCDQCMRCIWKKIFH